MDKRQNVKKSYTVVISLALVIIALLIVLIAVVSKKGNSGSRITGDPAVIYSPAVGSDPSGSDGVSGTTPSASDPSDPSATDAQPTAVPTGITTQVPTAVPTAVPPTDNPTPKPRTIGGKTSANPLYEGKRLVALTFDDGPQEGITNVMLDVLKKHNAKATFFVLGVQLEQEAHRKLLKRASDEGHQIGCHSYTHRFFSKLNDETVKWEVFHTNDVIKEITGQTVTVFRIPGGNKSQRIKDLTQMPIIQWNIDPLDWMLLSGEYIRDYASKHGLSYAEAESAMIDVVLFEGINTTLEGEAYYCPPVAYEMKHGSILLFHDVYSASPKAVDRLLTFLEDNYGNYVFLPFDEFILSENDSGPKPGVVYYNLWSE